ncbi:MAG: hypothetical protein ACI8TQ_000012 [Planctomycetota bacterium]|jgi:hypothetical protein
MVPAGWTDDLTQGPTAAGTLDLTSLAPQPGLLASATALESFCFKPDGVTRLEVLFSGSAALDNLTFRPGLTGSGGLTVETFESFADNTVISNQLAGLTISAGSGIPTVVTATFPVVPGEPKGLAHIPFLDPPDLLLLDFTTTSRTVGVILDFGGFSEGVTLTAFDQPGGMGNILGQVTAFEEVFISIDACGIKSAVFQTNPSATYLIDNLTYELE